MRNFAIGFVCVAAIGCAGEDETVSGVYPSSAFIGRTVRVQVTGDNTHWDNGTKLDFGTGITVSQVTAASPTSLFADITIAEDAPPGFKDVIVQDEETFVLNGAFEVAPPITAELKGSLAQGSVVSFTIRNFDFFSPFDDTCTAASLFGCSEYGNTQIEGPPGSMVLLDSVSPYTLSGTMYLDLDAAPGGLKVISGPPEATPVISPLGGDLTIATRAPQTLSGMATTTVGAPFESHLYEISADANALIRLSASSAGDAPTLFLLPDTGRFADTLSAGAKVDAVSPSSGKYYVVAANTSGESGFAYTLRANPLALTPLTEADAAGANMGNNSTTNAQTASGTALLVTGAKISDVADVDWYKITVPGGNTGKKVRVMTTGDDPRTDVAVEIYGANGTTKIGGADDSYHENVTSTATVGSNGVIYVKIFTDPQYYDPAHQSYIAAIWLE